MTLDNHNGYATRGVGNAALTTGIIGTAGVGLNLLNNLFGGGMGMNACANPNGIPVDRYTLGLEQQLQDAKTQIALRDANVYADQKNLELYKDINGRLREVEGIIAQQAVTNQATKDSFQLLTERLCGEEKARKCADNTIINYVNATFYPKLIADVTAGTTTTAQTLYNPLPVDTCCC